MNKYISNNEAKIRFLGFVALALVLTAFPATVFGATADIKANGSDSQITVSAGDSAMISWTSNGAAKCHVYPDSAPYLAMTWTKTSGSMSTNVLRSAVTYFADCTDTGGNVARDSVKINVQGSTGGGSGSTPTPTPTPTGVAGLPQITFSSNPPVVKAGESAVLTWSVQGAYTCNAGGAWSGGKASSGSETVRPASSVTYTLTCSNNNGSTSKQVTVGVSDPNQPLLMIGVKNVTAGNQTFFNATQAQGLDNLEFELVVKNGNRQVGPVTVQVALPPELFYVPQSTKLAGTAVADGIATSTGIQIPSMAANEEKKINFSAVVFFGQQPNSTFVAARIFGPNIQQVEARLPVEIKNRGQVAGAGTVVTGPQDTFLVATIAGFMLAMIAYLFFFKYRAHQSLSAGYSELRLGSQIRRIKKYERGPDA